MAPRSYPRTTARWLLPYPILTPQRELDGAVGLCQEGLFLQGEIEMLKKDLRELKEKYTALENKVNSLSGDVTIIPNHMHLSLIHDI